MLLVILVFLVFFSIVTVRDSVVVSILLNVVRSIRFPSYNRMRGRLGFFFCFTLSPLPFQAASTQQQFFKV
jgi:hypothetical protein